jgi:lipid-A-disaccharide synthase
MKIGIVAGEASGDLLGADLIADLVSRVPGLQVEGLGGPLMQAAGCHSLFDMKRLSVMGFIEPLLRLPDLISLRRQLLTHFLTNRPDVFIGIDAPDFNLGLEAKLHQAGIPIVHYVSPSVWAWRSWRIKAIKENVDRMLTLFPFEAEFYKRHAVPVSFVGHPLAKKIPLQPDILQAKKILGLDEKKQYIALLPGSRDQEIRFMAPLFLQAALLLHQARPDCEFITSLINDEQGSVFKQQQQKIAPHLPIHIAVKASHEVMAACDVALVTSGTATFELMLFKKPMVIAYRMQAIVYQLAKYLVKTRFIGLPNLLAGEKVVPECIQDEATPTILAEQVLRYLNERTKSEQVKTRFLQIHEDMLGESVANPSDLIIEMCHHHS